MLATNLPPATVSFLDGSFLRGALLSVRADVLVWQHPNGRQPLEFSTSNLNTVQFSRPAPSPPTNDAPLCRIRMTGGDEVEGRLVSLDAERFELETWFAGRLRGQRAGLASLTFLHTNQPTYQGPQAADEWRISAGGNPNPVIRRAGDVFFNNVLPGAAPAVPFRLVEAVAAKAPEPKAPATPELVAQIKAELTRLGDKATPVVKEALTKRLKEAEDQLAPQAAGKEVEPARVPGIPPPPAPVRPEPRERRALSLFNALTVQLSRQGEKTLVDYITRWEMALKDGQRLPNPAAVGVAGNAAPKPPAPANIEAPRIIRGAPPVLQNLVPAPAPAVNPPEQAVRVEIQRKPAEQQAKADALPPQPAPRLDPFADGPAKPARKAFSEAELEPLVSAAEKARTSADFLKSELVRTALAEKQTSRAVLEQWFAEFSQPADWQNDPVKTARFSAMLRAEVHLLERRLAGKVAPFEEPLAPLPAPLVAAPAPPPQPALAIAQPHFGGDAPPAAPAAPSWTFRDGAFYTVSTGTLGRECNLPAKARVEFDFAWKGQPYFRFQFYTRSVEHFDFSDGWQFYSSAGGYLYSMRRGGGAVSSARVPQMVNKNSVRLTFLLDTDKESVTVLADGEKVQEWRGLGRPGNGTGIVFYNYNASAKLRISNIRISPWDGSVGGNPAEAEAQEASVRFVNQDRATGAVQEIQQNRLVLLAAGGRLEIPINRVAAIVLPAPKAAPTTNSGTVQLTLHRNERLTLALERWEAADITAHSPVFGQLRLPPAAVQSLRFNPTAPRTTTDEWGGATDHLLPRP
ncbi:MAG: hypothetical protein B9S33_14285 [Pedosphaera sp. Tous-C6FEB]|nr:MAG: hypothetical protein B9S33_14285 [Pedosphaera sp. Tous-C6FEB]